MYYKSYLKLNFCDRFYSVLKMAINEGLLYEENDKGERILVKSMESSKTAYLRFTNRTSRPVDVWWRDFQGVKRHYVRLEPGKYYDVNSYLTHPWEFSDASTSESFVVNNKVIFRPPSHVGGMLYRTNWNITIKVRSLRRTVLLALATHLPSEESAMILGLPVTLGKELADLVFTLQNTPAIVADDG